MNFEQLLENFYTSLDLDGKIVIDIGAHSGRHTLPLAQLVGEKGAVLAFEPLPDIRKLLEVNLGNAKVNNVAVFSVCSR